MLLSPSPFSFVAGCSSSSSTWWQHHLLRIFSYHWIRSQFRIYIERENHEKTNKSKLKERINNSQSEIRMALVVGTRDWRITNFVMELFSWTSLKKKNFIQFHSLTAFVDVKACQNYFFLLFIRLLWRHPATVRQVATDSTTLLLHHHSW